MTSITVEAKPTLTVEAVRKYLRDAAEEFGADYVGAPEYATWNYFRDDEGEKVRVETIGCIVGYVWHRLGVPLEELDRAPYPKGVNACVTVSVNEQSNCPVFVSPAAEVLLARAMRMNDSEEPWGLIAEVLG